MLTLLIPAVLAASLAAPLQVASAAASAAPAASEQPVQDAVIKSKILAAFALDRNVSAMALEVQVERGVVQLGGRARTSIERDLAVEIARGTEGVREVHSNIEVAKTVDSKAAESKPAESKAADSGATPKRSVGEVIDDAGLTATVKAKLIANSNTPARYIDVSTRNGVVTLKGTVETSAQKELAGKLAENTEHVARVDNELTVRQR